MNPSAQAVTWQKWIIFPIAAFTFSRIAIFLVTGISLELDPALHRAGGPLSLPAIEGLCRWDCGWYQSIATEGYDRLEKANFFPLFPILGWLVRYVFGLRMPLALVLVANLAGLSALIVLYRLFWELEDEEVARTALMLFVSWPFAFFQATGLAESLMILATAACILLALRRQHVLAGVVLGMGSLARHLAILAGLSLLACQIRDRRERLHRLLFHWDALGLLLPILLFSLYPLFLWIRFGEPLAFQKLHHGDWETVGLTALFGRKWWPEITYYVAFFAVPAVGTLVLLFMRRWWPLLPFALGLLFVLSVLGLRALGRYTGEMWFAFLPLGYFATKYSFIRMPIVAGFALLQGMFLYLFVHSYPIN